MASVMTTRVGRPVALESPASGRVQMCIEVPLWLKQAIAASAERGGNRFGDEVRAALVDRVREVLA